MGIISDTWFSYVTKEWYGTSLTQDQFQEMYQEFLTSDEVRALPANATPEDYRRLYLQFIANQIKTVDPWFAQITQAAYGNTLTDAEIEQILRYFLTLPEVLSLPPTATEADYHRLFLRFLARIILEQDPWYQRTTLHLYGETTAQELERLLLDFLGSPEVISLPVTATPEDYQRLYVKFLSSKLRGAYQIELETTSSPEEIAKSKLMYSIFEILAEMLTTTSISQLRSSEVISYLTKKRNEYANMLSNVPLYVGQGTVDTRLVNFLRNQRYEGFVTITSYLDNSEAIPHWYSSLNVCEWYWTGGLIVTKANLDARLADVLQGLVNQIKEIGTSPTYYNSPVYTDGTWSGGGYYKQLIIRVNKNSDGSYTAYWARRSRDDTNDEISPDDWKEIGTFKESVTEVVVKVTDKPVMISSADTANTMISFNTDPKLFLLGYGGLSLQDVSESLIGEYANSTSKTASFTIYSGDWKGKDSNDKTVWYRNRMVINVTKSFDGKPITTVEFYQDSIPEESQVQVGDEVETVHNFVYKADTTLDWVKSTNMSSSLITSKTVTATTADDTAGVAALNSAFLTVWQAAKSSHYIQLPDASWLNDYEKDQLTDEDEAEVRTEYRTYCMNARDPKILWKPGILGSDFNENITPNEYQSNTLYSLNAATRAKINQRLQSYLSSISARLDVLSNLTDQQQRVVDASITGIKTTNNLIKGIIQQMMQILSAMFK